MTKRRRYNLLEDDFDFDSLYDVSPSKKSRQLEILKSDSTKTTKEIKINTSKNKQQEEGDKNSKDEKEKESLCFSIDETNKIDINIKKKHILEMFSIANFFKSRSNAIATKNVFIDKTNNNNNNNSQNILNNTLPCEDLTQDTIEEQWRFIEECPTHQISNHGRVRYAKDSCIRKLNGGKNYLSIVLPNNKTYMVHTLVAQEFLPPPRSGQDKINHINGIKNDNRASNLEWVNSVTVSSSSSLVVSDKSDLAKVKSLAICQLKCNAIIARFENIDEASVVTGFTVKDITEGFGGQYTFEYEKNIFGIVTNQAQNASMWVKIKDYPLYEICSKGIVRRSVCHTIVPQYLVEGKYITVNLYDTEFKERHTESLHFLLAKTFILNPYNWTVIRQKNSIKTDTDIKNLEWVPHCKIVEPHLKKAVFQYDSNKQLMYSWPSLEKACLDIDVSEVTLVRRIIKNKKYKGFLFSFDSNLYK